MKFSEKQVEELAEALYDDARDRSDTSRHSTRNGLTYDELKAQMSKHPGLLENLSIRYVYLYELHQLIVLYWII